MAIVRSPGAPSSSLPTKLAELGPLDNEESPLWTDFHAHLKDMSRFAEETQRILGALPRSETPPYRQDHQRMASPRYTPGPTAADVLAGSYNQDPRCDDDSQRYEQDHMPMVLQRDSGFGELDSPTSANEDRCNAIDSKLRDPARNPAPLSIDVPDAFDSDSDEEFPEYVPASLIVWEPFEDMEPEAVDIDDLRNYITKLNSTSDWGEKLSWARKFLQPYLDLYPQYSDWPVREFERLFEDAQGMPDLPNDDTRYIRNAMSTQTDRECDHGDECWCYFEATPGAGISGFSGSASTTRKDRKECIAFMHNLVAQFLMLIADSVFDELEADEKWFLFESIKWTNPDRNEYADSDYSGDEEDERIRYLEYDTAFQHLATGKFDQNISSYQQLRNGCGKKFGMVPVEERNQDDAKFLQLVGTFGRRALSLAICRSGAGHLFAKRTPIKYYNISENDWKEKPRHNAEQPRYPTRVINTHTLEFEEDQTLFQKSYAVLSHTWTQRGREVTYEDAKEVLAEAKKTEIRAQISKITERLRGASRVKNPEAIKKWKDEKETLEGVLGLLERTGQKRSSETRRTSNATSNKRAKLTKGDSFTSWPSVLRRSDTLEPKTPASFIASRSTSLAAIPKIVDPGKEKLIKACQRAKRLGFTYLWVDNCCINKPNHTELVEAIASMGDWYQNSACCLVYFEDFDGTSISDNLRRAKKIRYAQRAWTLQELVMSRRAVFYNKSWNKIADTKEPDCPREDLAKICRIPPELLCCSKPNVGASLIFQLATKRRAFKPEDRAYSLMGMLGVRMRADYGEGQAKAVSRLIEAVIRTSGDVTIFNWSGKYSGSSVPGRSMYPTDFDGYRQISKLEGDEGHQFDIPATTNVLAARVRCAITLDHFGVHARFDICGMKIKIPGDNRRHLESIRTLEDDMDCSSECSFTFLNGSVINVEVLCPARSLRTLLEELVEQDPENPTEVSSWVMARFVGVERSNWFLCEMRHDDMLGRDGFFADVWGGAVPRGYEHEAPAWETGKNKKTYGSFMTYLESSGFPARRLTTTWFKQENIPTDRHAVKNAYMWIG